MKKAAIQPSNPKEMANILNGKQTVMVLKKLPKWVLEELAQGHTVEIHLYCTKSLPELSVVYYNENSGKTDYHQKISNYKWKRHYETSKQWTKNAKDILNFDILNGLVVARFDLKKIDKFQWQEWGLEHHDSSQIGYPYIEKNACIGHGQLYDYLRPDKTGRRYGYALHISDLKIFDKPMELREFYRKPLEYMPDESLIQKERQSELSEYEEALEQYRLTRAPQDSQTVWVDD